MFVDRRHSTPNLDWMNLFNTAQEIPAGVYLTGKQTINPVPTQSKTATGNGTVTPDPGKYLSSVVVDVPQTGVELPTLDTPGTAEDLASGKQLIDANGNVVTGSVAEYDYQVGWKNRTPTIDGDSDIKFSINTTVPYLFRKGVYLSSPLSNFGDATAADVRAGKTFTSAEGLTVVGTNTLRDIKTITIKEV